MLDNFREWLSDNLRYILLGLAVVLILVIGFCVVKLVTGGSSSSQKQSSGQAESEISTEAISETTAQNVQNETAAAATASLVKDDAAILTLVKKYYTAAAEKDYATLETIVDPWNDEVKNSISRNDVIESYNNISTYSKQGPVANSYVVYTYFDGKVANIDTLAPSLTMLYVVADENGNLVVSDREASQEVADYIATVSSDADVQALIADVETKCAAAKEADSALKEFMDQSNVDSQQPDSDTDTDDTVLTGEAVATSEVNIRQEPNTSSAIMGVLQVGTSVTVLQMAEDGWCQVSYNAGAYTIEGYVKAEYLEASGSTADDGQSTADNGTAGTDTNTVDNSTADNGV
ncbi:MAG: SH3 domain-containing protein [Lachnospiraceae bacterium]|nr:SH3 domain-containing protein [Lachnospiraceae bacterium]